MKDKPDWDSFFAACVDDKPIPVVIDLLNYYWPEFDILIVTGRSESSRLDTEQWLRDHSIKYGELIMRPVNNREPDHKLKKKWAKEFNWNPNTVEVVFEDRSRVVKMWRNLGITCLQVADGDF